MGWGGRVPKARKGRNTGGRPQIFTILIIVSAWDPSKGRGTSWFPLRFGPASTDFHFAWQITCRIIIKIHEADIVNGATISMESRVIHNIKYERQKRGEKLYQIWNHMIIVFHNIAWKHLFVKYNYANNIYYTVNDNPSDYTERTAKVSKNLTE